jgi:hypothetical protein
VGQTSVQKLRPLLSPNHSLQKPSFKDGWRMFVIGFWLLVKVRSRNQYESSQNSPKGF